jgi:hypothetical protein
LQGWEVGGKQREKQRGRSEMRRQKKGPFMNIALYNHERHLLLSQFFQKTALRILAIVWQDRSQDRVADRVQRAREGSREDAQRARNTVANGENGD